METFIWILILVAIVSAIIIASGRNQLPESDPKERVKYSKSEIKSEDSYDFEIVGEASYQSELKQIAGSNPDGVEYYCTATLRAEPSNKYDPNAIKVVIEGKTVGYISRRETSLVHPHLRRGSLTCDAVVVGGWHRGDDDRGHYGVKLDLPI